MTKLSPAARAVWEAAMNTPDDMPYEHDLAAALRAAADQVAPDDYDPPREGSYPEAASFVDGKCVRNEDIRYQLLAIADELDGPSYTSKSQEQRKRFLDFIEKATL